MEWQNLPFAIARGASVQGDETVVACVLSDRIIDHHRDHPTRSVQRGGGDATTFVFPGKPRGDAAPQSPFRDVPVDVEPAADLVERLVLFNRIVDHEDEQVEMSIVIHIHHRNARALIFPREPSWLVERSRRRGYGPHINPRCPAAGDVGVGVEVPTNTVKATVLSRWIVNHHDNQFRVAVTIEIGNSDSAELVFRGEPIGNGYPRAPSAVDVSV